MQADGARDSFDPASPTSPVAPESPRLPSLTFGELTPDILHKIALSFARELKGADVRTSRLHKSAFVGRSGIDWLTANVSTLAGQESKHSCSRGVALQVAQWLLKEGHVWCCEGQKVKAEYVDDAPCYRHLSAVILLDDAIPQDVATFLAQKLRAPEGGIPTKEEKIVLKKIKG